MNDVQVTEYKHVAKGSLIGIATVRMTKWANLLIRDVALFEINGKSWVNMPSKQYEVDGKKRYWPYLAFENKEIDEQFKNKIKDAIKQYMVENPAVAQVSTSTDNKAIPF